jgi:hypothetical protein
VDYDVFGHFLGNDVVVAFVWGTVQEFLGGRFCGEGERG